MKTRLNLFNLALAIFLLFFFGLLAFIFYVGPSLDIF